jgi:hypothetical protein
MNSLPFQILYISLETSFLLPSSFNLNARQYLRTGAVLPSLPATAPLTTSHYVVQSFNPNDNTPGDHVPSSAAVPVLCTLSSYIQDFFFNLVTKLEVTCA